jgi:hypothetical protein
MSEELPSDRGASPPKIASDILPLVRKDARASKLKENLARRKALMRKKKLQKSEQAS